jgi:hypothetical protein
MKRGLFALFAVFLLVYSVAPTFAEESGSAIGTFGFGFTVGSSYGYSETLTTLCFDLDLVSEIGLAVSFGSMTNFEIGTGIANLPYIGVGYRYLADKWDIGLSVFLVPFYSDGIVGIKASGGYWFTKSLGMTLTTMFGLGVSTDITLFSLRPGISVRL